MTILSYVSLYIIKGNGIYVLFYFFKHFSTLIETFITITLELYVNASTHYRRLNRCRDLKQIKLNLYTGNGTLEGDRNQFTKQIILSNFLRERSKIV